MMAKLDAMNLAYLSRIKGLKQFVACQINPKTFARSTILDQVVLLDNKSYAKRKLAIEQLEAMSLAAPAQFRSQDFQDSFSSKNAVSVEAKAALSRIKNRLDCFDELAKSRNLKFNIPFLIAEPQLRELVEQFKALVPDTEPPVLTSLDANKKQVKNISKKAFQWWEKNKSDYVWNEESSTFEKK